VVCNELVLQWCTNISNCIERKRQAKLLAYCAVAVAKLFRHNSRSGSTAMFAMRSTGKLLVNFPLSWDT
jgi:hypothetical protein